MSDVMRAHGVEGVARVSPLLIQLGTVLVLPQGFTTNAQIYSIDPSNSALAIDKARLNISSLTPPGFRKDVSPLVSTPGGLRT